MSAAGGTARLFVGVWPPPEVLDVVAALPRADQEGVRWLGRASWHVTLRFLGTAVVDDAVEALLGVRHPPVTAAVGPAVARLGRSVVCLPVVGLDDLAAAVTEATAGVGRPPEDRPFRGHLTLARSRGRARPELVGHPCSARFAVDHVALVRSTTGHEGATYDTLERFSLTG